MSGKAFGPYRLIAQLGQGGMGEVWRAVDTRKDREVALKVLGTWLGGDADFVRRFRREAALAARLSGPHVIPIHDYGDVGGRLFIDMALVPGTNLAELIGRTGPLPVAQAVELVHQVAIALDIAHESTTLHRDVKPANIIVSDRNGRDYAYLIDFGISRAVDGTQISRSGSVVGTPAYMAPERFDGGGDHRADVYALAAVLYEALTAQQPFPTASANVWAQIKAHNDQPVPRPSAHRPELPRGLDAVIARGMAKAPDERYARATDLARAAQAAIQQRPAPQPTGPTGAPPWKLAVVGLVLAALALVPGVLRVVERASATTALDQDPQLLAVQQQVSEAASALRGERDEATLFVAEQRAGGRDVLEIGFGEADIEIGEMLTTVRDATELDATTISALQQAESQLSVLSVLRGDVTDNAAAGVNQVRGRYTQVVGGVDVLDRALLRQLRTPGTAGLTDALTAVTSANEQLAIQHTVLGTAIRAKTMQLADINTVTATDNQLTAEYREYQVALTPEQLSTFGNFLDDAANSQRDRLKLALLATPSDDEITLEPFEWDTAYDGSRTAAQRTADALRAELADQATAARDAADGARTWSVVLLVGMAAAIAVVLLVARVLIRPGRDARTRPIT